MGPDGPVVQCLCWWGPAQRRQGQPTNPKSNGLQSRGWKILWVLADQASDLSHVPRFPTTLFFSPRVLLCLSERSGCRHAMKSYMIDCTWFKLRFHGFISCSYCSFDSLVCQKMIACTRTWIHVCSPSCLHMFWSEPPPNSSKGTGWMPNLFHTVWTVRQFFGIHWFWSDYVRFEISPAVSVKIEAPHLQGKVTRVDPSMAIVRLFWEAPPGQRAAASSRWFMDIYGDLMNLIDDI